MTCILILFTFFSPAIIHLAYCGFEIAVPNWGSAQFGNALSRVCYQYLEGRRIGEGGRFYRISISLTNFSWGSGGRADGMWVCESTVKLYFSKLSPFSESINIVGMY